MKARYQYRIYPTDQQQRLLAQLFGCVRVVWNDALALCRQSEKLPQNGTLQTVCITKAKQTVDRRWLSDVSNVPLQQSIQDLGAAFKNFFDSRSGKRKGKKMGLPRFKKKTGKQSARFTRNGFSIKGEQVYLAKIGLIDVIWSRPLPTDPSSVTVIKDKTGRYFLSFVVEVEPKSIPATNDAIGIDLGLKTFAVLSTGEKVESPDYKSLERRLRRAQRKLSRRVKGSKRREKARLKVAKLHRQIADKRKDFLHKLSTRIVIENQVIVLEDLNVQGMMKNRRLARAISLQGWSTFRSLCNSKAQKFERDFQIISRWEPTSQVCSCCGYRWGKLDLSTREITCVNCGSHHDRDENAAVNIKQVGLGHSHDSKRTGRECQTPSGAVLVEPSTQLEVVQLSLFAC